jgi:hypothetical protein
MSHGLHGFALLRLSYWISNNDWDTYFSLFGSIADARAQVDLALSTDYGIRGLLWGEDAEDEGGGASRAGWRAVAHRLVRGPGRRGDGAAASARPPPADRWPYVFLRRQQAAAVAGRAHGRFHPRPGGKRLAVVVLSVLANRKCLCSQWGWCPVPPGSHAFGHPAPGSTTKPTWSRGRDTIRTVRPGLAATNPRLCLPTVSAARMLWEFSRCPEGRQHAPPVRLAASEAAPVCVSHGFLGGRRGLPGPRQSEVARACVIVVSMYVTARHLLRRESSCPPRRLAGGIFRLSSLCCGFARRR